MVDTASLEKGGLLGAQQESRVLWNALTRALLRITELLSIAGSPEWELRRGDVNTVSRC